MALRLQLQRGGQVGYIACFGMAVETGIVMLVYLREAIDERGGLARIGSIAELRQAILEGAVHRLRPKLLTEGVAIISIAPMLWATGVGAEVIRPMAAPVLGGLLIADEVIDVFLPVLYFAVQKRRWRKLHGLPHLRAAAREAPGSSPRSSRSFLKVADGLSLRSGSRRAMFGGPHGPDRATSEASLVIGHGSVCGPLSLRCVRFREASSTMGVASKPRAARIESDVTEESLVSHAILYIRDA